MDTRAKTSDDDADRVRRDPQWNAIISRDKSRDGQFYYSVATTGVYCRPSCPSRLANPKNVRFHATAAEAERAGYRPCKRCRPGAPSTDERRAALIAEACRRIVEADEAPSLAALARGVGLSPYHFHRMFKAITGSTPKAYALAHKAERVRGQLAGGARVTDAFYDAGYGSSSRFYERSEDILGMTPTAYRGGGAQAEIRFAIGQCSLGAILVAASDRGVCAVLMGDDPDRLARDLQDRFARATLIGADAGFEQWVAKVVGFVETPSLGLDLPLDLRGTVFQHRVWRALREIPLGSTASYGDIARKIGAPKAARAVAQACANNALAVIIPCHRVVRANADASGYRWGVERKKKLLDRERDLASLADGAA